MSEFLEIFREYEIRAFFTKKIENFENFKSSIFFKIYLPIQRHTDHVIVLQDYKEPEVADAVITNRRGLFVGIKTADCLPILIFDPQQWVIGAVHAGWRGTAKGILKKTVIKMDEVYGCNAKNLLIAMGPCIKGCCYEVGEEVIKALKKEIFVEDYILRVNSKKYVDLSIANLFQAISLGVKRENISISEDCTYCKHDEYASYRFHGKKAGRQYGIIGML